MQCGIQRQGNLQRHRLRLRHIDRQAIALLIDEAVNRRHARNGQDVVSSDLTKNGQGTDTRTHLRADVTVRATRLLQDQVIDGLGVAVEVKEGRTPDGDVHRSQEGAHLLVVLQTRDRLRVL